MRDRDMIWHKNNSNYFLYNVPSIPTKCTDQRTWKRVCVRVCVLPPYLNSKYIKISSTSVIRILMMPDGIDFCPKNNLCSCYCVMVLFQPPTQLAMTATPTFRCLCQNTPPTPCHPSVRLHIISSSSHGPQGEARLVIIFSVCSGTIKARA